MPKSELPKLLSMTNREAATLAGVLSMFFGECNNIYRSRAGSMAIYGQILRTVTKDTLDGLEYQQTTLALKLDLPYEAGELGAYPKGVIADRAVKTLVEGTGIFREQANRHLNSEIYYPAGKLRYADEASLCNLTVMQATFGRFLIGYADDHMRADYECGYEIAPVAATWTLAQLFQGDPTLMRSYRWLTQRCGLNLGKLAEIEQILTEICTTSYGWEPNVNDSELGIRLKSGSPRMPFTPVCEDT